VLPSPAPFYLTVLRDEDSSSPQFWWCTPGEGLRAGPMCSGGLLGSGLVTGRSSLGSLMIENHRNAYLPTGLRYRTCNPCSTAWMHHFTLEMNNSPVRPDLTLDYVLGALDANGVRTVERRLGGAALDSVVVTGDGELMTLVGAVRFVPEGNGVIAQVRAYSEHERAASLAAFGAGFRRMIETRSALMAPPRAVAAEGDPEPIGVQTAVAPLTEVFRQLVALPDEEMPFPEGERPTLFVDYVGAVGDAWDGAHQDFRPRFAWFVFGYARHTGGRWHALVPVNDGLVLAGQRLIEVVSIDANGMATLRVVGGVPTAATSLRAN
jgi:hypothetical protein